MKKLYTKDQWNSLIPYPQLIIDDDGKVYKPEDFGINFRHRPIARVDYSSGQVCSVDEFPNRTLCYFDRVGGETRVYKERGAFISPFMYIKSNGDVYSSENYAFGTPFAHLEEYNPGTSSGGSTGGSGGSSGGGRGTGGSGNNGRGNPAVAFLTGTGDLGIIVFIAIFLAVGQLISDLLARPLLLIGVILSVLLLFYYLRKAKKHFGYPFLLKPDKYRCQSQCCARALKTALVVCIFPFIIYMPHIIHSKMGVYGLLIPAMLVPGLFIAVYYGCRNELLDKAMENPELFAKQPRTPRPEKTAEPKAQKPTGPQAQKSAGPGPQKTAPSGSANKPAPYTAQAVPASSGNYPAAKLLGQLNGRTHFQCPNCKLKIMVQNGQGRVVMTCPWCKKQSTGETF